MKAMIEPLRGKYYGTIISILDGPAKGREIEIWLSTGEPSKREIESWGYSQDDWDNNIEVEYESGETQPIQSCDFLCDSHYECKESLRVAEAIVEALSRLDDK